MKCKIFWGNPIEAMEAFNKWAEGKALSRDVIIHTVYMPFRIEQKFEYGLCIVVYHPEGAPWEGATDKWEQAVKNKHIEPTGAYEKAIAQ